MLRLRLLLTLIIAGSLTLPLQAATITVADNGADHTSIQAAIDAAGNGDEIIVAPGTYLENINFSGKAITVRSASGDPADTIIDGGGGGMWTTSFPTVTNCILWGDSPDEIFSYSSSFTAVTVTFRGAAGRHGRRWREHRR